MLKVAESRRSRVLVLSLLIAGPVLAAGGCAYGELKQVLRAQVASETNCGDVTVENSSVYAPGHKPNQYRVRGCGLDRTYDCPEQKGLVSYGAKVCSYTDAKSVKPPEAAPPPPSGDTGGEPMDAPPPDDSAGGEEP